MVLRVLTSGLGLSVHLLLLVLQMVRLMVLRLRLLAR
jgi:hypothetical protein